ncbi:MAG: hypothetical protein NZ853_09765 [Leptospiraceae bacterium]|nr:hypothetical protein [Leptospiraceae bacterium]MDW7976982.1 hypothetical protein [Leptospiraceae bacterium]
MMAGISFPNDIHRAYPNPHDPHDVILKNQEKIPQNDPLKHFQEKNKEQNEEKRVSLEELQKSLIKPKEIKRLIYLAIPFTRHFITELDKEPKGFYFDSQG